MTKRPYDPINPAASELGKCERCGHDTPTGEPCDNPNHDARAIIYGIENVPNPDGNLPNVIPEDTTTRPADMTDDFGHRYCESCLYALFAPLILQMLMKIGDGLVAIGKTPKETTLLLATLSTGITKGFGDMILFDPTDPEQSGLVERLETMSAAMRLRMILNKDDATPDDLFPFGGDAA